MGHIEIFRREKLLRFEDAKYNLKPAIIDVKEMPFSKKFFHII